MAPDPVAVPGTVAVPHGAGPWPGVVLVAGSGSLDRDETIGRNKPFKDIAWGLASRGVAVLRFDKVTYTHAAQFSGGSRVHLERRVPAAGHRGGHDSAASTPAWTRLGCSSSATASGARSRRAWQRRTRPWPG